MPGKVFISCGQAFPAEKEIAAQISDWLKGEGYAPYVAIEAQSIQDVNSGIIGKLKSADYYIFIDFRREKIHRCPREYRGSLFTNQELAVAHYLHFDEAIFLQQSKVKLEGSGNYMLSNAKRFDSSNEVLEIVEQEIKKRKWTPNYSRHLVPVSINILTQPMQYGDHTGARNQYICHVGIENKRNDVAAFSTIAFLDYIELPSKQTIAPDSSYLKWVGLSANGLLGYQRAILPGRSEKFDAFAIDSNLHNSVYLHSAADLYPRQPILQNTLGQHILHYQVFAIDFPVLNFEVVLDITSNITTTTVKIV